MLIRRLTRKKGGMMGLGSKGLVCIASGFLFAGVSMAEVYRFAGPWVGGDKNWFNGKNWQKRSVDQSGWEIAGGQDIPGADDEVDGGAEWTLAADAGIVKRLQIGSDDRGGKLTLNDSAKLFVYSDENMVGNQSDGTLIVNGGQLSYGGYVSIANDGAGTFLLRDGLVRIDAVFYHNRQNGSGVAKSTIQGGVLDVNVMMLNSGVLDISGGLVRVRFVSAEDIQRWIADGRMTFNGVSGGMVGVHYQLTPWGDSGFEIRAIKNPLVVG